MSMFPNLIEEKFSLKGEFIIDFHSKFRKSQDSSEIAHLYRKIKTGAIGGDPCGGEPDEVRRIPITYKIEVQEYHQYDWWREALKVNNISFKFLGVPLLKVLKEISAEPSVTVQTKEIWPNIKWKEKYSWEDIYLPENAYDIFMATKLSVTKFNGLADKWACLLDHENQISRNIYKEFVKEGIKEYFIRKEFGVLRLCCISPNGDKSKPENFHPENPKYQAVQISLVKATQRIFLDYLLKYSNF
jgi:hypothetical protein